MIRWLYILIVMTCLSACAQTFDQTGGKHNALTPSYLFLKPPSDDDSPFGQGVRDGCNTAIGIIGSGLLRTHGFSYDVNRGIYDKDYYAGYRFGQFSCMYYIDRDVL